MKTILFFLVIFTSLQAHSQNLSGTQLLIKAIAYHDPNGVWSTFKGTLSITMASPDKEDRISKITLNLPKQYFKLVANRGGTTVFQELQKDSCVLKLNGNKTISKEDTQKHGLTCDRAETMKNYYTYLYGLPMKLRDAGTIIDPKIERKMFKGKEYLVLKVTYPETVGNDIWYFYFDPATYAMEVYQFYHDESLNEGEYILLSEQEELSGIRMPKIRKWYKNMDDEYLGTDILSKVEPLN